MDKRVLIILLSAFAVAAGCSFLVYRMTSKGSAAAQKPATTRIVAAAADVKLGTLLSASNLTTIEMSGPLPKGALVKPQDAIGRAVITDLSQGEPILESHLAPVGSGGGLAAMIKQGMRAVAVHVDEVVGVSGFVTPGMHVDVVITGNLPGAPNSQDGTQASTLLQNIEVLSAGTDIEKDEQGKPKQQTRVVNLLVTPEQAEKLSLAQSAARIQLVLRNPTDTEMAKVPNSAMGELFGGNLPPQAHRGGYGGGRSSHPAAAPAVPTVLMEVINGSQRTVQKFPVSVGKE